ARTAGRPPAPMARGRRRRHSPPIARTSPGETSQVVAHQVVEEDLGLLGPVKLAVEKGQPGSRYHESGEPMHDVGQIRLDLAEAVLLEADGSFDP
ncbi:MAG: hypothetical protein LC792_00810, partial [Actinobacteria bacterium]|nr:hypothetical protein [Actinomycetota bacterium]